MPPANQDKLQTLLETCRLLSAQLDLPELLNSIMDLASRVVEAETASLLLLDPQTQELYFDVALGLDPQVAKIRLKLGQGIAGTVAIEGKPVIINDVAADPRWSSIVDKQSGFQTRSILAAPLQVQGGLIGVVEAINHKNGPFTFSDLRIFEAFASQAATAIDNARLFARLREEKSKLDAVFSRMGEGALLADEAGRLLLANAAARKLLDIPPGAAELGACFAGLKTRPATKDFLTATTLTPFEAVREKPKELVLEGTVTAINAFENSQPGSASLRGRLLVFRDATEDRHEEALKRTFLSLISHKLKTPLASVIGYAQLLLEDPASGKYTSDLAVKSLQTILTQGRKLSELVDKLLRFLTLDDLRGQGFDKKPFKIDGAITAAASVLKPWLDEMKANILLETSSGQIALGNAALIEEAIKNLIENAVKFNPKPEKKVAIWAEPKNGFVEVHVSDQGPGIPPEDQDKIFGQFHQVEPRFTGQVEGWGLGLPLVKKIVEEHGGSVALKSKLDSGTTVSFTIPRAEPGGD